MADRSGEWAGPMAGRLPSTTPDTGSDEPHVPAKLPPVAPAVPPIAPEEGLARPAAQAPDVLEPQPGRADRRLHPADVGHRRPGDVPPGGAWQRGLRQPP